MGSCSKFLGPLQEGSDNVDEDHVRVERLEDVPVGAEGARVRRVRRINGGDHDDGDIGVGFVDMGEQREPALSGHRHVAQHQGERSVGEDLPSLGRIGCGGTRVPGAFEEPGQGSTYRLFVLDDEDAGVGPGARKRHRGAHCDTRSTSMGVKSLVAGSDVGSDSGNRTVMVVPTPSAVEIDALPPDRLAMP